MSTPHRPPTRVVPAQLSFLAIYNPALSGETDESFRDQLVFYYSRAAHHARATARKSGKDDAVGGDALHAEENEKLRQIGLAQGMLDFANTFSHDQPVDSIETEKSRIILHELERGWWVLASIDLTRLPSIAHSSSTQLSSPSKSTTPKPDSGLDTEYSSREVSPPALLTQQLLQAHDIFCLHHGPSLNDLFVRLARDKFCNTLDRFWTRFARTWDVLLHGNPAVDLFNGIKLASGGELGFGVGEEEWGSGEREVLEGLIARTEGLVDVVVSRFGDVAPMREEMAVGMDGEGELPWMGSGNSPVAPDGLIFGGVGALRRHSLRSVSLWMRQIYTYGEQAYGVRDNVLRERRKRRRPNPPETMQANEDEPDEENRSKAARNTTKAEQAQQAKASRPDDVTSKNITKTAERPSTASRPSIPPPIVSASGKNIPRTMQRSEQRDGSEPETNDEFGNMLGISDTYMKYLTFGLSTLGKPRQSNTARQVSDTAPEISQSQATSGSGGKTSWWSLGITAEEDDSAAMTHVEPIPDGEALKAKLAIRKRQENRGHFVIGLKGDLLELDDISEDDRNEVSDDSVGANDADGSRIVLRTVQVELVPIPPKQKEGDEKDSESDSREQTRTLSSSTRSDIKNFRRLRILVYVHRPFMYAFLFDNHASSLQLTKFYKTLHRNLVPIHKPLLLSTDPKDVALRISVSQAGITSDALSTTTATPATEANKSPPKSTQHANPIYALIYDPSRLTLHTSIPNIPDPGTPAAEGFFTFSSSSSPAEASAWTRVEALNVHSQILNTLSGVKTQSGSGGGEVERASKTSRGWWVVWIKVATAPVAPQAKGRAEEEASSLQAVHSNFPSGPGEEEENQRIAFLVRKAPDIAATTAAKPVSGGSRAVSSMLEVMSLGIAGGAGRGSEEDSLTGGASAGWGPGALAGGMGVDARRYVEGLLSLCR